MKLAQQVELMSSKLWRKNRKFHHLLIIRYRLILVGVSIPLIVTLHLLTISVFLYSIFSRFEFLSLGLQGVHCIDWFCDYRLWVDFMIMDCELIILIFNFCWSDWYHQEEGLDQRLSCGIPCWMPCILSRAFGTSN